MPIWLPNGVKLIQNLKQYLSQEYDKDGYQWVQSPHIADKQLFIQSGHYDKYSDSMYAAGDMVVKPMSCPFHIEAFKALSPDLNESPLRLAEFGQVYRKEQSGEINGLLRVRSFVQDDGHIFLKEEDLDSEMDNLIRLYRRIYQHLGFGDFKARLSIRGGDRSKYIGNDDSWEKAENSLLHALRNNEIDYSVGEGEASFYGPKIDFLMRDRLDREWQLGTIQVDYNLPERFDLRISDNQRPVLIHRAVLGSLERAIAVLLEQQNGWLPEWLSPIRPRIIPVGKDEKYLEKAQEVAALHNCDIASPDLHLSKNIKKCYQDRVPRIAVIGDKELDVPVAEIKWQVLPSKSKVMR